jgi:hypothetical protein
MSNDDRRKRRVLWKDYMAFPEFQMGVRDRRAGLGFHADYEGWERNQQVRYERGRQMAAAMPNAEYRRFGRQARLELHPLASYLKRERIML